MELHNIYILREIVQLFQILWLLEIMRKSMDSIGPLTCSKFLESERPREDTFIGHI